ncbi:ribonuclease, Rne/Rng family protein [Fictibacillus macauensis ZFHKF-1]|uniref:Ribonuclease, Rne/Rng family protein n=1 Tax=Fictibacillus macauensis ZFHKF-1 TaxID=1196324 RepID=I8UEK1_9BACL|nr:Rne/Rng family ribonuclease [Fictibacillus macauensis]EIT85335.1 ribonuclease, Rne/Rng family protein [Fictibacillus macauensis ZFHKF-1]
MERKIIIDCRTETKRMTTYENNEAVELRVEERSEHAKAGNIYSGRVQKVLPGMQAAFVDIGGEKNGFIHRDDLPSYQEAKLAQGGEQHKPISAFVKEGDSLLVQVVKEQEGGKGARLTGMLSIPGSCLVFLPEASHIAVSKKMSRAEKEKWRTFGQSLVKGKDGVIFRTASVERTEEELHHEFHGLVERYRLLVQQAEKEKAPVLLYDEEDVLSKLVRDYAFERNTEIIVDDPLQYRRLLQLAEPFPSLKARISLHKGRMSLSAFYEVDAVWEKALQPHVWLKNGASLKIDHTEAMTVIDVNTDKFTGKKSRRETVLQTNVIAAKEIAQQLRLRGIGGMIVVDFITMNEEEDQRTVKQEFAKWLARDRTTTVLHGFTRMGVFEMTRKKERRSLLQNQTESCAACGGTGRLLSAATVSEQASHEMMTYQYQDYDALWIEASAEVFDYLQADIEKLEAATRLRIFLTKVATRGEHSYHIRQFGTVTEIQERIQRER